MSLIRSKKLQHHQCNFRNALNPGNTYICWIIPKSSLVCFWGYSFLLQCKIFNGKFDSKGRINKAFHFYDKSKIWPVFSTIPVPDHSRKGNISLPFPKVGNGIFHSPSHSRKLGMEFSFPLPKVGNAIFHSRSRSQNLGMQFCIPVPVTGNGFSKSGIRTGIKFKRWEKEGF